MISRYKNLHSGPDATMVIMGNGPSLSTVPRALLDKYLTFGSNGIFLMSSEPDKAPDNLAGFIPDYYCATNPLVVEQNLEEIKALKSLAKFIREDTAQAQGFTPFKVLGYPGFYVNPEHGLFEGFTVTYVMLQLAYFMGIKRVLLVGVDHYYKYTGGPNEENTSVNPEANHAHPSYFVGQRWNNPDLGRSAKYYGLAKRAYEADGREVINLTPDSKLDVFTMGKYKNYL